MDTSEPAVDRVAELEAALRQCHAALDEAMSMWAFHLSYEPGGLEQAYEYNFARQTLKALAMNLDMLPDLPLTLAHADRVREWQIELERRKA